MYYDDLTIV